MSDVETLAKQFTAHLELNNTLIRELTAERDALRAFLDAARAELAAANEDRKDWRDKYHGLVKNLNVIGSERDAARAELAAERERNAELRDAAKSLYLSTYGTWGAFERALRDEIGNTNYTCIAEKLARIDALVKENDDGR